MIKNIILLLALLIMPIHIATAADTGESVAKPLHIAVVDVQQLMNNSDAAKSIQKQGEDLKEKYQKRIGKLEDELKKAEQKVIEAGEEKDQEKFMERRKDFQEELAKSQREIREMNQNLDRAVATALNELRDEIVEIVSQMTVKNKYDMVLTRADVVTVSKDIDITAAVMERLNDEVSSIRVRD